jgi:hypothetical protein
MVDRRDFLAGLVVSAVASSAHELFGSAAALEKTGERLVPESPVEAPSYWCTWAAQNYMYGHNLAKLDTQILEGDSGSKLAHDAMTEDILFGKNGWATAFFPKIRKDVFLLLDDGWQVGGTATFELDSRKFPSFTGSSIERLKKLNHAVEAAGWRSTALWCRNTPGGDADHHLERVSQSAGIRYWKIDIGDPAFNLVRLRDETHIPLTLEHVSGEAPVNGDWRKDGRFGPQSWDSRRMKILQNTDVFRTYDVTAILSLPTTLDRVAEMLKGAEGHSGIHALLNVEDEVYLAAAMGCTMGILRHPMHGMRPGSDADLFFNGPRQAKRRMDEVVRALRWQRIAPPFVPGVGSVMVSEEVLTDSWVFERGQTWQNDIVGMTVAQGAPAAITRDIDLPEIRSKGEKPFITAARFPNGAIAIAAHERTKVGNGWFMPKSDVTLSVVDAPGPFGVFGYFDSLTLVFNGPLQKQRILAQDLAGDRSFDITNAVRIRENSLFIPGGVMRKIGLHSATPGDISAPGLVIALR